MTTYVVAGGCFWCADAVFRLLRGVTESIVGYAGGSAETANYYSVVGGSTDHAEAVQVTFDESVLPKETLLDIFFLIHDPTSLNKQGADAGPQYRSALFYQNEQQKTDYQAAIDRAQSLWDKPIVTTLEPLDGFYKAEAEQQDYYATNPYSMYCPIVISPKIRKAKKAYTQWFKETK